MDPVFSILRHYKQTLFSFIFSIFMSLFSFVLPNFLPNIFFLYFRFFFSSASLFSMFHRLLLFTLFSRFSSFQSFITFFIRHLLAVFSTFYFLNGLMFPKIYGHPFSPSNAIVPHQTNILFKIFHFSSIYFFLSHLSPPFSQHFFLSISFLFSLWSIFFLSSILFPKYSFYLYFSWVFVSDFFLFFIHLIFLSQCLWWKKSSCC